MIDLPRRFKAEEPADAEGIAIAVANGYRCKRPNKRPSKSRGHGYKAEWKEKLRKKRQAPQTRPPAVKVTVPVSGFLQNLLAARPESWSMKK